MSYGICKLSLKKKIKKNENFGQNMVVLTLYLMGIFTFGLKVKFKKV
jgi:hypothetical protein